MTIIEHLINKHTKQDSRRGWMCVSEKEWNAYYHSHGAMHAMAFKAGKCRNTLSFRGCQLRVL